MCGGMARRQRVVSIMDIQGRSHPGITWAPPPFQFFCSRRSLSPYFLHELELHTSSYCARIEASRLLESLLDHTFALKTFAEDTLLFLVIVLGTQRGTYLSAGFFRPITPRCTTDPSTAASSRSTIATASWSLRAWRTHSRTTDSSTPSTGGRPPCQAATNQLDRASTLSTSATTASSKGARGGLARATRPSLPKR